MRDRIIKSFTISILLIAAIASLAVFAGPTILRAYIETGIGNCRKIPILCMKPTVEINNPEIRNEYISNLLNYDFPKMSIRVPKGFAVSQELIKKSYQKKWKHKSSGSIAHVLRQEPDFFTSLFPQAKKQGIHNNYEFIERTMYSNEKEIKSIADAFFVIMKSVFIPDLGDQKKVVMARFTSGDKKGFINYNLSGPDRYFDCNAFDREGNLFAIYIKDKTGALDLEKVFAIISTAKAK